MKKLKYKLITGFRKDQEYVIEADELHKAYYLFTHPEERAIFANGVAMVGKDIRGIQPDYHATMGWNPAHTLTTEDYNEINREGVKKELHMAAIKGKNVARLVDEDPTLLLRDLSTITSAKSINRSKDIKRLGDSMRIDI
jgi:hypothetical protein